MNNKLVIAALVIAVLLIGGGAYLTLNKSQTSSTPQKQTAQETPKESPTGALGTLKSLLAAGKSQACKITYPNNTGSGMFYVSDKKFSGEFKVNVANGKEVDSHTVSDGTYVYAWASEPPMGVKMKLDSILNSPVASPQSGSTDFNQEINYQCSPWITDNSKFQIPTNIQFTDVSGLMNKVAPSTGTQTQGTSPCDQIANPQAKAACESALKSQQ